MTSKTTLFFHLLVFIWTITLGFYTLHIYKLHTAKSTTSADKTSFKALHLKIDSLREQLTAQQQYIDTISIQSTTIQNEIQTLIHTPVGSTNYDSAFRTIRTHADRYPFWASDLEAAIRIHRQKIDSLRQISRGL